MKLFAICIAITLGLFVFNHTKQHKSNTKLIYEEIDGVLAVEAEHFFKKSLNEKRSWEIVNNSHASTASGHSYLECEPDTRVTHDDKLISGENFSNKAGQMAIIHYKVYINNPGKYYVWVRAYSTGSEDNGIHVGIDDSWPASGQRMQWCDGKNEWTWESKQRTDTVHCGEPELIYLEIEKPGQHEIQFSMREDGFEFDKFMLTKEYKKPEGTGPEEIIRK